MSNSWPSSVPESLWNYGRLQIQDASQVPMMGVKFSNDFQIAFVVGFVFVGYVAWTRFNAVQSEADGFRYRVMREVGVADLGGTSALRRAYFIYLATMLALYIAFTFFGKLIVQTVNSLNVVGIQVDSSSLQFDSPQWPLLLAFGFAGLAPLVPQLRGAENWLFRRAYRAVGIPVRIDQTTRNLLDLLAGGDKSTVPDMAKEVRKRSKALEQKIVGTWIHDMLDARDSKLRNALGVLAELEVLLDLAKGGRGAWPGPDVSASLRKLELELANSAEELLDEFDSRIAEAKNLQAQAPGRGKSGAASESAKSRRAKYLSRTLKQADELREELVAVLAVYVERDPVYVETLPDNTRRDKVRDVGLRKLLEQADPPNLAGSGPELGALTYIALCAPIYALFAWKGLHPLLSPRADAANLQVVLATTLVECLRLLSIFWFPLLAAFGLRQFYCDKRVWVEQRKSNSSAFVEQRLTALLLGFGVSVLCLVGLAALWAFFIAKDVTAFRNNLVAGNPSFLLFYPSMAVISLPVIWNSLAGADLRARNPSLPEDGARLQRSWLHLRGLFCGAMVLVFHIVHMGFWYGGTACTRGGAFLLDIYFKGCFLNYGALDFITMPILAFLCVVMFGEPHASAPTVSPSASPATPPGPGSDGVPTSGGAALATLALCLLAFTPGAGFAQGVPASRAGPLVKTDVVRIGFREDTEPFSYRSNQEASQGGSKVPLYKGFLADLCYWIFEGSHFAVEEWPVTATDRFERLRNGPIDVLCDPVTMRFSDEERTASGTYSPIVFATGISYLRRENRAPGPTIYVGYVDSSTATRVAQHTCQIDLFNIVGVDERADLARMCKTAVLVRDLEAADRETFGIWADGKKREALRAKAKSSAREERKAASDRVETAGANMKPRYLAAVTHWDETLKFIDDCAVCKPGEIAEHFGPVCNNPTSERPTNEWAQALYRLCPMPTHTDLTKWFCKSREKSPGMVYLGDREIILGKLRTWNAHEPYRCDVESETATANLTYEPYALMTGRIRDTDTVAQAQRREEITRLVQRRVYEFFSFSSLARAKFDTYFLGPSRDWTMSDPLAYLFVLNSVEEEWQFSLPPPDEEQPSN